MNLVITSGFCSFPSCPLPKHFDAWQPKRLSNLKTSIHSSPTHERARVCECFDLHDRVVPYGEAWTWQKNIVREKREMIARQEEFSDTLIALQHSSVYTLGTWSSVEYMKFDLKEVPVDVYRTERGGEVTYHGPGQLVMYPIINLRYHKMDLHWYLRMLEEVVIRVLSSTFSIKASRIEGLTGVWVGDQKLAAIGIRVSQWITFHGLALNVTADLEPFHRIVPCGIHDRGVGSIKGLLTESRSSSSHESECLSHLDDNQLVEMTHESLLKEFSEVFQLEIHKKDITSSNLLKATPSIPSR